MAAHPLFRSWLVAWVSLVAVGTWWAVANPLGNSPDEPAQIARAASVVRGHPIGHQIPGSSAPYTQIWVPRTYALGLDGGGPPTGGHNCYHFNPFLPASCEHVVVSGQVVATETYVGHYPLSYYAVVGLPSLFTSDIIGPYLMRVMSVILSAAFLALAFAAARQWARSPLLAPAVLVVATPTELFLAASVNPSGLEIAASICLWVAGAVMVIDQGDDPPRGLIVIATLSACTLSLTRPLSVLWVAIAIVVLGLVGYGRIGARQFLRRTDVRVGTILIAVTSLFSVLWVLLANGLAIIPEDVPSRATPGTRVVSQVISALWDGLGQTAGTFGWNETHEPEIAVAALVVALSVPVVLLIARARTRDVYVFSLLVVLSAFVPLVLLVSTARHSGIQDQGRYYMPLWVAPPLFAAATSRRLPRSVAARLSVTMVLPAAAAIIIAFWWNVHRTTVGIRGPYLPWTTVAGSWSPPVSATVLDLIIVPLVALYAGVVLRFSRVVPPPVQPAAQIGIDPDFADTRSTR